MGHKNVVLIALAAVLLAAVAAGCTSSTPTVKSGYNVTIDYIINSSNGTMYQTSYVQVAKDLGAYDANWGYTTYRFQVDDGNVIAGINDAVIGMKVNETRNVAVPPEKAYGAYNKSWIMPVNLSDLTAANITPYVNQTITSFAGHARVDRIDAENNTVYLDYNRAHAGETLYCQVTVRKID
jgi:FKBP-type peptidyl-prolyl cis-trans isomerase 2